MTRKIYYLDTLLASQIMGTQCTMGQQVDLLKKPEISPKRPFIGLLHPHELPVHENVLQTSSNQPQEA